MDTLVANEECELTRDDCREWLGTERYNNYLNRRIGDRQRIGQAWMNSLEPSDYQKLYNSYYDCFYADNWPAVIRALRFLLEN